MATVKEYRVKAKLTQGELAERMKVSKSAVSMWESGKRTPKLSTLKVLAALLGVTVDELVNAVLKNGSDKDS